MHRAQSWEHVCRELEQLGLELEAELRKDRYVPTSAEREAIRQGISDVEQGRFVSQDEIDEVFAHGACEHTGKSYLRDSDQR